MIPVCLADKYKRSTYISMYFIFMLSITYPITAIANDIFHAVKTGNYEQALHILDTQEVDINQTFEDQQTLYAKAVWHGHYHIAFTLLERGANTNRLTGFEQKKFFHKKNTQAEQILINMVDQAQAPDKLVDRPVAHLLKAIDKYKDSDYGDAFFLTIINYSISIGQWKLPILLLEHFSLDPMIADYSDTNCMQTAIEADNKEMLKYLLLHGHKPSTFGKYGLNAFRTAIVCQKADLLCLLLHEQKRSLIKAVINDDEENFYHTVNNPFYNIIDEEGNPLTMIAALHERWNFLAYLVKEGADLYHTNTKNTSAYEMLIIKSSFNEEAKNFLNWFDTMTNDHIVQEFSIEKFLDDYLNLLDHLLEKYLANKVNENSGEVILSTSPVDSFNSIFDEENEVLDDPAGSCGYHFDQFINYFDSVSLAENLYNFYQSRVAKLINHITIHMIEHKYFSIKSLTIIYSKRKERSVFFHEYEIARAWHQIFDATDE